jgi:hypothetical protein
MIFSFLYLQRAAQGLFPNVNPLITVLRGERTEDQIDSGYFNLHMQSWKNRTYPGMFMANYKVKGNEVVVDVDGQDTVVWLPPTLQLSEWFEVTSSVVLPQVQCYDGPLSGEWDNNTIYPFGRSNKTGMCFSNIQYFDKNGAQHGNKKYLETGITVPENPSKTCCSTISCFDTYSGNGLFVFLYMKDQQIPVLVPGDLGIIQHNPVFANAKSNITEAYSGIPCNYTLLEFAG